MLRLYQFRGSHFCEKVRWALEYKGLAWQPVDLLPGRHGRVVRALAPRSSVPVLVDDGRVVQGSAEILSWLDHQHEGPRLTPTEAQAASLALEWERWLDNEVGVTVRLWWYHHLLDHRRAALAFLLDGAPAHAWLLYTLMWPQIRRRMRRAMNIDAQTAAQAEQRLRAAFDRLDGTLAQGRYLVAGRFTRADLTAAALLRRLCLPPAGGLPDPPAVQALRAEMRSRPWFQWVRALHAERGPGRRPA